MSWEIKLDKNWGITSDKRQFVLNKITKDKNEELTWMSDTFHNDLSHLLKTYRDVKIKSAKITKFEEVVDLIKQLDEKIDKISNELGV